jgi:hypothetical protein
MILLVYLTPWGTLGCGITRLEALIDAFYQTTCGQGVDGSLFAFAWSIILQEPSVYVGILPPGDHSEVYVAPPPRGSKKNPGKARETTEVDQVASLKPVGNSKSQSLEKLKQLYGERLRIAVDSEVLRATLAGPHAKVCSEWFTLVYITDIPAVLDIIPNGLHGFTVRRTR